MDVQDLGEEYPNPPVYSVSWEMVFAGPISKETFKSNLDTFSKDIIVDYPNQNRYEEFDVAGEIKLDGSSPDEPMKKILRGWGKEYKNDLQNEVVKLADIRLVLIKKAHKNFAEFQEFLYKILSYFESHFDQDAIELRRLGLRYINYCKIKANDPKTLNDYFNLNLHLFKDNSLTNLSIIYQELVERYNFRTQYHSVIYNQTPHLAIDLDCFITNQDSVIEYDKIYKETSEMQKLIKERFALSITEEFVSEVMEVKNV